jgi:hypothetical protein
MSMKSTLSAVALVTLAAVSTMATANANPFPPICDGAVSMRACGDHMMYLRTLRLHGRDVDTSPTYMKSSDPRDSQAMLNGGGGGGGGGGR